MKYILSVLALAAMSISPVQAQQQCLSRQTVVEVLASRHAEAPVSMGITSSGFVLEVFSSAGGSWSIVITTPRGCSRLTASGQSWSRIPVTTVGSDS